ncbi:MAG: transglycosylase domain-containing protein [Candidatus Aenigmatarchaeota archaeon]
MEQDFSITPKTPEQRQAQNNFLSIIPLHLFESARIISGQPEQETTIQKGQELEVLLRTLLAKKLSDPNLSEEEKKQIITEVKIEFSRLVAETRPDILLFAAYNKSVKPSSLETTTSAPKKPADPELTQMLEDLANPETDIQKRQEILEQIKQKALTERWNLFDYYQEVINYHSSKWLTLGYRYPQMLRWICLLPEKSPNRGKIKPIDEMIGYFGINFNSLSEEGRKDYQENLLPEVEDFQRAILQADEEQIKKTRKKLISALKEFYQKHKITQKENPERLVNHFLIKITILSDEELQELAFSERWDLEEFFLEYCQALKSVGRKPPSIPKETDIIYYQDWVKDLLTKEQKRRLRKVGGILGINDIQTLVFQAAFRFITQPETESQINDLNPLSETHLQLNDNSILRYFKTLQEYLIPIEELITDPQHDQELPLVQGLLKKRINDLSHKTISLILALSNFGVVKLSKKERRILSAIPQGIDLSDGFLYQKELGPALEKGERKRRKALMKERKRWFNTLQNILHRLNKQNLPFVILLPEEQTALGEKLQDWQEQWRERVKRFRLMRLFGIPATALVVAGSAAKLSQLPLLQEGSKALNNAAKIAYQQIFEQLEISSPSSFFDKWGFLIKIYKSLKQIEQETGEETLFAIGASYFNEYAERINKERFSQLTLFQESTPPVLTEADFVDKREPPPQTLKDLLTILETEQGREKMIESLTENFYQLASFKFADEDQFSFISQQNLRTRLEQITDQLKVLLNQETDKNKRIDTLNPVSKKQKAVSDWQQLIIEILKYYSPQLSSTISLLQPEIEGPLDNPTKYTDLSHEYACKRQAYYFCEEIFYHIASEEKPSIIIHSQQELEDFSSFFFDKQKFIEWLNNPNNNFENEEERWQFVSWAITLAEKQQIDLDLISRFVELNRFFQGVANEKKLEQMEEVSRSILAAGSILNVANQGLRQKVTRRDFLRMTGVAAVSTGLMLAGIKADQQFQSHFEVVDRLLQRFNGQVWQETEQRLRPILTLNPTGFPQALVIKDVDGQEIGRYFETNKEYVSFDQIPQQVIDFLVNVEDKRFFDHPGIDPIGIARGFTSGGESGGGSTLTQQLIRLFCYSQEELLQERLNPNLAYKRKMVEIVAALIFEKKWEEYYVGQGYTVESAKRLTKQKILEIYLNNVPFGPNVYGIKAASKFYFNKEPQQLTPMEIAFLIGLIQNPVGYYPFNLSRYDQTSNQNITLGQITPNGVVLNEEHPAIRRLKRDIAPLLYHQGVISKDDFNFILNNTITLHPQPASTEYQPLSNKIINQLLHCLSLNQIFSGLEITITLDKEKQKQMEELIKQKLQEQLKNNAQEGAIIILDGETGAILVAAGATQDPQNPEAVIVDNNIPYQENFPGSSVKPFTYAAGLSEGILHENQTLTGNTYRGITNSGGGNYGPVLWPQALASSLNTAAQQLADWVDVLKIRYYWDRLKIRLSSFLPLSRISTNITLGTERVRPIDLAGAFTVFTNAGQFSPPTLIQQVSQNGQVVFNLSSQNSVPIFSQHVAQQIVQALGNPENKIYPSPQTWQSLRDGIDHQGRIWYFAKTGTESNSKGAQRAVWCVGGVINHQTGKKYVVLTYLGTQNSEGMTENVWGSNVLAPLWRQIAGQLIFENPNETSQKKEQIPTEQYGEQYNLFREDIPPEQRIEFAQTQYLPIQCYSYYPSNEEYQQNPKGNIIRHPATTIPREIIIHWDGQLWDGKNPQMLSAQTTINGLIGNGLSCHFVVSPYEVIQTLPMGQQRVTRGFHAGGRYIDYNIGSIGIETTGSCYDQYPPPERQTENLVNLIIKLMVSYNIPLSKVVGHYERTDAFWGKPDPGEKYMQALRKRLKEELEKQGLNYLIDLTP